MVLLEVGAVLHRMVNSALALKLPMLFPVPIVHAGAVKRQVALQVIDDAAPSFARTFDRI
jgi:hypothetical protein